MLEQNGADVRETRQARREPLGDADVAALLSAVRTVTVARGKSARTLPAAEVRPDDLRGPTGSYRAPILRVGDRLLVGFHPEALRETLKGTR